MSEKKFFICYASQTGNAESIAKELHDHVSDIGPAECMSLNQLKQVSIILYYE